MKVLISKFSIYWRWIWRQISEQLAWLSLITYWRLKSWPRRNVWDDKCTILQCTSFHHFLHFSFPSNYFFSSIFTSKKLWKEAFVQGTEVLDIYIRQLGVIYAILNHISTNTQKIRLSITEYTKLHTEINNCWIFPTK